MGGHDSPKLTGFKLMLVLMESLSLLWDWGIISETSFETTERQTTNKRRYMPRNSSKSIPLLKSLSPARNSSFTYRSNMFLQWQKIFLNGRNCKQQQQTAEYFIACLCGASSSSNIIIPTKLEQSRGSNCKQQKQHVWCRYTVIPKSGPTALSPIWRRSNDL